MMQGLPGGCGMAALVMLLPCHVGCGGTQQPPTRYELSRVGQHTEVTSSWIGDWNGNGTDEVYLANWYDGLVLVDDPDNSGRQINCSDLPCLAGLARLGDGRMYLAVSCLEWEQHAWLSFWALDGGTLGAEPDLVIADGPYFHREECRWAREKLERERNENEDRDRAWICRFRVLNDPEERGKTDFDGDGIDDLIISAKTGYQVIPRGIMIWSGASLDPRQEDGPQPKLIGWFPTKGLVGSVDLIDLEYDGCPEILVNLSRTGNWDGKVAPAGWPQEREDDRGRAVLLAYDRDSQTLRDRVWWEDPREVEEDDEPHHFQAWAGPDKGGVVFVTKDRPGNKRGILYKIELTAGGERARTLDQCSIEPGAVLLPCWEVADSPEFVVASPAGRLEKITDNLSKPDRPVERPELVKATCALVQDLAAEDGAEILIASHGSLSLNVLSLRHFEILASHELGAQARGVHCRRLKNRPSEIVVRTIDHARPWLASSERRFPHGRDRFDQLNLHDEGLGEVDIYQVSSPSLRTKWLRRVSASPLLMAALAAGGGAAAMLLLGVAILVLRRRRGRDSSAIERRREHFLETLRSVGHGKLVSSTLDRLRMLVEDTRDGSDQGEEILGHVEELARSFREVAWPQLARIPDAARAAGLPPGLVASYEQALGALQRVLIDVEPLHPDDLARHADVLVHAIDDANALRRRMLDELSRFYRCDPVVVLGGMLEAALPSARGAGVVLDPLRARLAPGARAFIAECDFRILVEDLLTNALRAVEDQERRHVSVSLDTSGEHILLEISDTGRGIPDEIKVRIFERGFTTTEGGTGLGLWQAVEILDRFGGRIFVSRTQLGEGTTMSVELKRV